MLLSPIGRAHRAQLKHVPLQRSVNLWVHLPLLRLFLLPALRRGSAAKGQANMAWVNNWDPGIQVESPVRGKKRSGLLQAD
jgi:hypothetical protein|uniref:Uncharacterized protein n=2 Tax=Mus TaxID=862507 RepID=Q3UR84_MOUSE|nr:unnamed protein product [Mus musculus]BAE24804.1 unnamed protein product [Mus musculus]